MTVDDVRKAAEEWSFRGGLKMWKARARVTSPGALPLLLFTFYVPQDDNGSANPTPLEFSLELTPYLLDQYNKRGADRLIVDHLAMFTLHEMYESVLVGGAQMFDPHNASKYHPGAI